MAKKWQEVEAWTEKINMCTGYCSVDHWQATGLCQRTEWQAFSATFYGSFWNHLILSIFPRFYFFPQMHTWGKAKAFRKQSINSSSFIAMSGHQYLWDCAGKVFYWNSANLYTSFIEFRGYDSFLQQRKPLRSPNLWDHIVYLGRLKLSITEGGATVICMLHGWICMLTELARRHWCLFFFFKL